MEMPRLVVIEVHWKKKVNVAPRYNKLLQPYHMDARPISVSLATSSFINISGYNIFYSVEAFKR